jgi:tetratricopeptide (TPR) repeat protein
VIAKAQLLFLSAAVFACNANSPDTKFLLAEKLLEDKKFEAAVSEFQAIVDKSPNSGIGLEAQLKVAEINHFYLGRSQEAVSAYQEFLKRNKDENRRRDVEKTMADLQFQNFEDYDQAIATYSKLLKGKGSDTEKEEMIFRLGRAFFLKAKFEDSMKMLEYQKAQFPQGRLFWKAQLEIAHALSAKGDCKEAIKQYSLVAANAPKDLKTLSIFGKAACLEEQDELDDAYELFSSIKSEYPAPTVVELKMQKIKRRKILRKR